MTELWVTSIVIGSWVLAAGLVALVGSFLAGRRGDRQLAMRVAQELFGSEGVEPPATAEAGVEPAALSASAFAGARPRSFADPEMTHVPIATA